MPIPARPLGPLPVAPLVPPPAPVGAVPGVPATPTGSRGLPGAPYGPENPYKKAFNWAPYADGSWLQGQMGGDTTGLWQQLRTLLGALPGQPGQPAAPAVARPIMGRPDLPAPGLPARSLFPGRAAFTPADFPLLAGLLGKQPGLVPPPNFLT